jgi:hypothetical protein
MVEVGRSRDGLYRALCQAVKANIVASDRRRRCHADAPGLNTKGTDMVTELALFGRPSWPRV